MNSENMFSHLVLVLLLQELLQGLVYFEKRCLDLWSVLVLDLQQVKAGDLHIRYFMKVRTLRIQML
jgi:hypothetical protein